MKMKLAVGVLLYGMLLAGLGALAHEAEPETAKAVLLTGLVSGGLCVLWGVIGLLGHRRRTWTALTLSATILVLIPQMVNGWMNAGEAGSRSVVASLAVTAMLFASVGLMMFLMHSGGRTEDSAGRRGDASSAGLGQGT